MYHAVSRCRRALNGMLRYLVETLNQSTNYCASTHSVPHELYTLLCSDVNLSMVKWQKLQTTNNTVTRKSVANSKIKRLKNTLHSISDPKVSITEYSIQFHVNECT